MAVIGGTDFAKILSKEQLKELALNIETDFEITKIKSGIFLVTEKEAPKQKAETPRALPSNEQTEIDAKIFALLNEKKLSEKVEGKFEKFLSPKENLRFKELLKEGAVFAFKLSDKYKKPVYKISEQKTKDSEKNSPEKPVSEYCLEKDGLMVCTDKQKAEKASYELREAVKSGKILGIKSFDGNYYIIESGLLQKYRQQIAEIIQANKSISQEEIAKKAGISRILAKIACEFLKEDGEIVEKKTGHYFYVE